MEWIRTNPLPTEYYELKDGKETLLEVRIPWKKMGIVAQCFTKDGEFEVKRSGTPYSSVFMQGEEAARFRPEKWYKQTQVMELYDRKFFKKMINDPLAKLVVWEDDPKEILAYCSLKLKGIRSTVDFFLSQKLQGTREGLILSAILWYEFLSVARDSTIVTEYGENDNLLT